MKSRTLRTHYEMESESAIIDKLRRFLTEELQVDDAQLSGDMSQDLWGDGLLDSMGLVRLIAYLESEFGVTFAIERLAEPDFVSLGELSKLAAERGRPG